MVSTRSFAVVCGALVLTAAALSTTALAQATDAPRKLAPEEWDQVKPLFKLVEDVAAGNQAPSNVAVLWQHHFLKTVSDVVLVPFTLAFEESPFTSFPLAMYLRVVPRGAPAPAPGPRDALAQYPFEDAAVFNEPANGRISRAFVAPAGEWDVYVALREKPEPGASLSETVVIKQPVSLPDLGSHLAVSSVIVADKIEVDAAHKRLNLEEQLDDPYALWGTRITPAFGTTFGRSGRLSVIFVVYNTGAAASGKPDVSVQYDVRQTTGGTETFFGSTRPQVFNAGTLAPEFSLAAGDLIIAGQEMPLAHFPDGDYRLVIGVADNTNGKSLQREVNFTVAGP